MTLNPLIPQLIGVLAPLLATETDRRALLIEAFGVDSPLLMNVDFEGATQPFILNLLAALHAYGEVEPGKSALWVLLNTVKNHVGIDIAERIDALEPQVEASAAAPLLEELRTGRRTSHTALGIVLLLLLFSASIAVYSRVSLSPLQPLPAGFNVVVAGFGMEQVDHSVKQDQAADNVSDEIYAALGEVPEIDNLLPSSDSRVGRILDSTEDARYQHALQIASSLNADVIIYGTTSIDGFYLNIDPVFEIAGDLAALEPELSGQETFGAPLQVLKDSDDDLTAQTAVRDRLTVMRYFLRGISQYITGDFDAALTTFNTAITVGVPGTEMLYVFAGNAAMRQNDPTTALTLYSTALQSRPGYARALGGRGLALFRLATDLDRQIPPSANRAVTVPSDAFCTDEVDTRTPQNYAALAAICYQQGLASSDQPPDSDVDVKLNFALGQLELWRSMQNYGDRWNQASAYLTSVLDLYNASDKARQGRTQQIAAQAHAALAQLIISTQPNDQTALQAAADHYSTAISLLESDVNRTYNTAFIDDYKAQLAELKTRLQSGT